MDQSNGNEILLLKNHNLTTPLISIGPLPPTPSTSLIIYGPEEWTLHPLGSPSPICLSPQGGKSLRLPICFISKLIDGKNIKSGSFYKIKLGCDSKTKKINIHFCMDYFNGKSTRVLDVAHGEVLLFLHNF